MDNRIITTDVMEEDFSLEGNLRPQTLDEYIGQEKTKNTLKVYIEAAKQRHDSLDHVLFYGPPGLGKTTLSGIIANEMGVHMKVTSGPAIEKPGEMAAILNNLQEGDILFVDEIHRLNRQVEEVLYPAMEDFAIDIMIGKGASARSIRLDLPKFTLVGATTRAGLLSAPLRDRFGVIHHLEFYSKKELTTIIRRLYGKRKLQLPFRYSFPECIMVAVDHFDLYARIILEARQQPSLLAVPHVHAEQTHAHQLGIRLANRTDIGNARIPQPTLFVQITEKDPARRRQLDALLATDEKLRA